MTLSFDQERGDVAAVNWKAVHEAATAHDFFESYHGKFYEHEGTYLQSASPGPTDQSKVGVPLLTMQSDSDFIIEHGVSFTVWCMLFDCWLTGSSCAYRGSQEE